MRVRRHSVTDGLQGLSQSPFPHSGPCGTVVVTSSGVVVTPSTSPSPRQPHTSQHSSLAEFVVHCAARLEISSGKTRHQGVGHVGTILLICMPRALESARHRSHAVPSHRSDTAPSPHQYAEVARISQNSSPAPPYKCLPTNSPNDYSRASRLLLGHVELAPRPSNHAHPHAMPRPTLRQPHLCMGRGQIARRIASLQGCSRIVQDCSRIALAKPQRNHGSKRAYTPVPRYTY